MRAVLSDVLSTVSSPPSMLMATKRLFKNENFSLDETLAEAMKDAEEGLLTLPYVSALIRRAYGRGYCAALSDHEPLEVKIAQRHYEEAFLRLPVS